MVRARFSDRDIERFLSGTTPDNSDLLELTPLVDMLRVKGRYAPSEASVRRYAAEAAEMARSAGPTKETVQSAPPVWARRSLSPRFAATLAAVLLLTGMTGVAVASDEAAPGDGLYGIDRALENFGVGAGGSSERLAEAGVLANNGKSAKALAHAAEAIAHTGDQEAADALLSAAERLKTLPNGGENALEVRAQVAEMLEWMATTDVTGREFGQGVAERARGLAAKDGKIAGQGADKDKKEKAKENNGNGPPEGVPPVNPGNSGG